MIRFRAAFLFAILAIPGASWAQAPVEVEPSDLSKRKDLIGREVIVDDRVKFFFPVAGKGYPEIILARTEVPVVLPDHLAYRSSQSARSIRARGILRRKADGSGLFIDATQAPELFKTDVERLKAIVATLGAEDLANREAWGDWAARRAKAFDDDSLKEMADRLAAESISLEYKSPKSRNPDALISLAKKARTKGIREPEPSAIAHMGLRLKLASIRTLDEFEKFASEVRAFLINSKTPNTLAPTPPAETYLQDPYTGYRTATPEARAALDRRLWTEAQEQIFRLRATDPKQWKTLGEEAKAAIPDRPEIGGGWISRFYEKQTNDVTTLRESEMRELARTTREDLKQPEKADALTRTWLDHQRKSLGANDSEQRVELATKYLGYLKDRTIAADLAREALKIDSSGREATELFQRMGFVRSGDSWRDPNDRTAKPATPAGDDNRAPVTNDPLIGLSPAEVKSQLGEPKRISRIATQGRVSIQWIYETGRGAQYVDFVQRAGDPQPIVVGRFAVR